MEFFIEPNTSAGPLDDQLRYGETKTYASYVVGGVAAASEEAIEYLDVLARGYPGSFVLNCDLQR